MKKICIFLLSSLFLTSGYSAESNTNVSGQIFANFSNSLTNNSSGNKLKGFNLDRARVKFDSTINETWKSHIAVEAKQGSNSSAFFIKKAYIQGSNLFLDKDYFRTGITSNMYKDNVYKVISSRWIEKIGGDYDDLNGEHSGLRYGASFGAFHGAVEFHNGNQDNKTTGTADDAVGAAVYLSYKLMDSVSLHAFHNTNSKSEETTTEKNTTTTVAVGYNHMMFDLLGEYTKYDDGGTSAPVNTRISLDWHFNDLIGGFLSINKFTDDDSNAATSGTIETKILFGPSFNLAKGLKTGVFYTLSTPEDSSADKVKSISWNWEANF